MTLEELGWKPFFADQLSASDAGLVPARVWRQDIDRYLLIGASGEFAAILLGRLRARAISKADLPTVGDWVLVSPPPDEISPAVIEKVLARISKFSRKQPGDRTEEQVVAANVDTVFIVGGLDQNFNPNRIDRYLLVARESGARPVIVLNKADVCADIDAKVAALKQVIGDDTPVCTMSALTGEGLEPLRRYLGRGQTVALLGSSGVGKSTVINALLGYDRFETSEVRAADAKGRHTTTFREMCSIPDGGMIIDTPGMRELQLWSDEAALSASFEDIEELALACRFTDCRHESEPGCAVMDAIDKGELSASRLENYRKYQRELKHLAEKLDPARARAERRSFSKNIRKRPTKRD